MTNRGILLILVLILPVMFSGLIVKLAMGNDSKNRLYELVQGLPETIDEWRKSSAPSLYDAENLYTYINGGAELYISYYFNKLISQSYVDEEDDEIKIDIFDMGSSQNAYGIFSHSRETIDRFVGSNIESEYGGGLLTFWKGQYYVSILAYPETESRKLVVQKLAQQIAAQIQEQSHRPDLVALLPEFRLQPHSIRYFKHFAWLNMYHFFSTKNLLNIDEQTEVVMARYMVDTSKPTVLILLKYPNEAAAITAQNTFKKTFMVNSTDEFTKGVNQLWMGCIRDDNLVMVVVDAPNLEAAQRLVKSVE